MVNILDLIPSKDIKEYLKSINYKMNADDAFNLVMIKLYPSKKIKEYLQCIIDTCNDKEDFFQPIGYSGEEDLILSTWHYFISEFIKRLNDEGDYAKAYLEYNEKYSKQISFEHYTYWPSWGTPKFPTPFKEGDIVIIPETRDINLCEPAVLRKINETEKGKYMTVHLAGVELIDEFVYCRIDESGKIWESLFTDLMQDSSDEAEYLCYEYYKGKLDGKYTILKEMSDACKNNKFEEFFNKNRSMIRTIEDIEKEWQKTLNSIIG